MKEQVYKQFEYLVLNLYIETSDDAIPDPDYGFVCDCGCWYDGETARWLKCWEGHSDGILDYWIIPNEYHTLVSGGIK